MLGGIKMGLRQDIEILKKQLAAEKQAKKASVQKVQNQRATVKPAVSEVKPTVPQQTMNLPKSNVSKPQAVQEQVKPKQDVPQQAQKQQVNPENMNDLQYFVYCYKSMKVKFQRLLYNGTEIGFRIRYGNRGIDFFYNSFKRKSKYKNFADTIHTTLKPTLSDNIIAGEKGAGTQEEFDGKIKVKDVQDYIKSNNTKVIDIVMERVEAAITNTLPAEEQPLVANWGLHR